MPNRKFLTENIKRFDPSVYGTNKKGQIVNS